MSGDGLRDGSFAVNYDALVQSIVTLHKDALGRAALAVNRSLVMCNWMVGAYLVEFEQDGADRAAYGTGLLSRLSRDLRQHDMKGVSPDVLERMRLLYLHYPQLRRHISETITWNSPGSSRLPQSVSISATPSRKSDAADPTPLSGERLLQFSWSHLVELLRLDDPWKRAFYENGCLKANWSVRQLQDWKEIRILLQRTIWMCGAMALRGGCMVISTPDACGRRPRDAFVRQAA